MNARVTLAIVALPLLAGTAQFSSAQRKAAPAANGAALYATQCASCHGSKGQGAKGYPKPLVGDRSIVELSNYVSKSMPPGPKHMPLANAKVVAAYLYDAFYSPIAQARNRPARVELARLTVPQYRNSVADLISAFRPEPPADSRRGLRGEYFKSARPAQSDRVLDRIDPELNFNYGTAAPLKEQPDPYVFAMRWTGSILAPDTGEFEFILRTDQGARLWINDLRLPVIDATVKSGNQTEFRASHFLLAGRRYPVRIEFSKGVTGVNNLEKLKQKPVQPAFIELQWRPPQEAAETIPVRCLSPAQGVEQFAPSAPFPPDDRSIGYERGTSISKAWDEATTEAAIETTTYVAAHMDELAGLRQGPRRDIDFSGNPAGLNARGENTPANQSDRASKLKEFCIKFAQRAFRGPLSSEETQAIERRFAPSSDPEIAVKQACLYVLKSPRFVYLQPVEDGSDGDHSAASLISYALWDGMPDRELLKAAETRALNTEAQVRAQVERMVHDGRSWTKLRSFLMQWLRVDHHPELSKEPKRYPGFDDKAASDLRSSLGLLLEQVVWSETADFRDLFRTRSLPLNGRLAPLYGINMEPGARFQTLELDGSERAGVLTHPYVMAAFAYRESSSPIHRGMMISRNILGRTLRPPPEAVAPIAADLHPNLTTRQRVELQTKPQACTSCHSLINPLGFTLEKFDAIGRMRSEENGKPVDCSGSYVSTAGKPVRFGGAKDLAEYIIGSEDAHRAFVERLFHSVIKQPVRAFGPKALDQLVASFRQNEFNIRKLMTEMVVMAATSRG